MSNYKYVAALIKAISGKENVIATNVIYARYMDGLEGGVFLSQLVYWSDKSKRNDGFFYKTYKDWKEETFIGEYAVRKYTKSLSEKGIIETKLKKANGSPTIHYKLNMDILIEGMKKTLDGSGFFENEEWNLSNESMESLESKNGIFENEVSLTEITTEITTEILKPNVQPEIERDFDEFYQHYPVKKGKANAVKAYAKARKNKHSHETIMNGLMDYKQELQAKGTDKQFIKQPATFLNGEHFNDEYDFTPAYSNNKQSSILEELANGYSTNGTNTINGQNSLPQQIESRREGINWNLL